jgi:hypothetical protein
LLRLHYALIILRTPNVPIEYGLCPAQYLMGKVHLSLK